MNQGSMIEFNQTGIWSTTDTVSADAINCPSISTAESKDFVVELQYQDYTVFVHEM